MAGLQCYVIKKKLGFTYDKPGTSQELIYIFFILEMMTSHENQEFFKSR